MVPEKFISKGKVLTLEERPVRYQLVGSVMDYQGFWRVGGVRARPPTLGLRTAQTPTGGCSREYSTMDESLMERRRVRDEGPWVVNRFCMGKISMMVPYE